MEIAAAGVPSLCIPAARPFDEQVCKAAVLRRLNLSVVVEQWPAPLDWPALMKRAIALEPNRWQPLQTEQAAARVAEYIVQIAQKCAR